MLSEDENSSVTIEFVAFFAIPDRDDSSFDTSMSSFGSNLRSFATKPADLELILLKSLVVFLFYSFYLNFWTSFLFYSGL